MVLDRFRHWVGLDVHQPRTCDLTQPPWFARFIVASTPVGHYWWLTKLQECKEALRDLSLSEDKTLETVTLPHEYLVGPLLWLMAFLVMLADQLPVVVAAVMRMWKIPQATPSGQPDDPRPGPPPPSSTRPSYTNTKPPPSTSSEHPPSYSPSLNIYYQPPPSTPSQNTQHTNSHKTRDRPRTLVPVCKFFPPCSRHQCSFTHDFYVRHSRLRRVKNWEHAKYISNDFNNSAIIDINFNRCNKPWNGI